MLGERLKNLRRQCRFSQDDLAKRVGVTRQTIAKWENDESIPDILVTQKIVKILGVPLSEIIDFEEKEDISFPEKSIDGRYVFGKVVVGVDGNVKIPKEALQVFAIKAGEELIALGDIERGLEFIPANIFWENMIFGKKSRE